MNQSVVNGAEDLDKLSGADLDARIAALRESMSEEARAEVDKEIEKMRAVRVFLKELMQIVLKDNETDWLGVAGAYHVSSRNGIYLKIDSETVGVDQMDTLLREHFKQHPGIVYGQWRVLGRAFDIKGRKEMVLIFSRRPWPQINCIQKQT